MGKFKSKPSLLPVFVFVFIRAYSSCANACRSSSICAGVHVGQCGGEQGSELGWKPSTCCVLHCSHHGCSSIFVYFSYTTCRSGSELSTECHNTAATTWTSKCLKKNQNVMFLVHSIDVCVTLWFSFPHPLVWSSSHLKSTPSIPFRSGATFWRLLQVSVALVSSSVNILTSLAGPFYPPQTRIKPQQPLSNFSVPKYLLSSAESRYRWMERRLSEAISFSPFPCVDNDVNLTCDVVFHV